ncbi:hypothetical protein GCM10010428_45400 [Actinosynnema pretiosum subsp. pretiosum]
MGTVRNRVAHGKLPIPTPLQITTVVLMAHTLATGIALRELGVPSTVLRASIEQGIWRVL